MQTQKSKFGIYFYTRSNSTRVDGLKAIEVRVTVDGVSKAFTSIYEVAPEMWNQKEKKAVYTDRKSKVIAEFINNGLDELKMSLKTHYINLLSRHLPVTAEGVINAYFNKGIKEITLIKYAKKELSNMEKRIGIDRNEKTHSRYVRTVNILQEFLYIFLKKKKKEGEELDIPIRLLTPEFVEQYDTYLRTLKKSNEDLEESINKNSDDKLLANNQVVKYVERFKYFFKRAKYEYDKESNYNFPDPFIRYKFVYEKTKGTKLTDDEIDLIYKTEFINESLNRVRDVFIFCSYTGLAYADVSALRKNHFVKLPDGTEGIIKPREKTDVPSIIRLLDIPKAILQKYEGRKMKDGRLLPVISNQKMNQYLKDIAEFCKIEKRVTSHVARHSFATSICMDNGVALETVSKMLGHSNIAITKRYASVTEKRVANEMAELAAKLDYKKSNTNLSQIA